MINSQLHINLLFQGKLDSTNIGLSNIFKMELNIFKLKKVCKRAQMGFHGLEDFISAMISTEKKTT